MHSYFSKTLKVLAIVSLLILFWLVAPVKIEKCTLAVNENGSETQESVQPLKTQFLLSLPQGSRREVEIDPPATRIVVTSQSGDTAIRCGDSVRGYSCAPGKRLELTYDPATPARKFWAENSTEVQVRLRIEVYEVSEKN